MIYLEKGKALFENSGMVVYDKTGYYEDGDSVLCAMIYEPENPVCRYEAKFIAYGSKVYNISDSEILMEEIKKIDPENLFNKSIKDINEFNKIKNVEIVEPGENINNEESYQEESLDKEENNLNELLNDDSLDNSENTDLENITSDTELTPDNITSTTG